MRTWAAAVVVGVAAVACAAADPTEEMVREALVASGIEEVDVQAAPDTVRLSGAVETLADRTRAVELAAAIVGPTRRIANEITVSGLAPPSGGAGR